MQANYTGGDEHGRVNQNLYRPNIAILNEIKTNGTFVPRQKSLPIIKNLIVLSCISIDPVYNSNRIAIDFWHWGELFALSDLLDSARHHYLKLIFGGKSKLECNKALQAEFNINKRYCNSIYTEVQAIVSNINENRTNHIKVLSGQIKSIKSDINQREKQIKDFAKKEKKQNSKSSNKDFSAPTLKIKKACVLNAKQRQSTQLQDARFFLHQKKWRLNVLENQRPYQVPNH